MITLADLRPGDLMFGPISGATGLLVGAGQLILGDATPDTWRVRHVAVVTKAMLITEDPLSGSRWVGLPQIVQAMPSGAEEIMISDEHWTSDYTYVRPGYFYERQPLWVAKAARNYVKTPYSFADYLAIAGVHLGIKNGRIRRYVTTSKHMICSQLADQAMTDADFHTFSDGRLPQDVTPAALYHKLLSMAGSKWVRPGMGAWVSWR